MSYSSDREREMFTATCGDCGNECQIPFKPKGDRPVYCREFSKIINQNQEVVADQEVMVETEGLVMVETEGLVMVETEGLVMVETEGLVMVEETIDHEKCLMQNAEIVEMIAKYHSNQKKTDLFIVMNASKNIETISKLF